LLRAEIRGEIIDDGRKLRFSRGCAFGGHCVHFEFPGLLGELLVGGEIQAMALATNSGERTFARTLGQALRGGRRGHERCDVEQLHFCIKRRRRAAVLSCAMPPVLATPPIPNAISRGVLPALFFVSSGAPCSA